MPVVPARMHPAVKDRAEVLKVRNVPRIVGLGDRQGVHIEAQRERGALAPLERGYDPRQPARHPFDPARVAAMDESLGPGLGHGLGVGREEHGAFIHHLRPHGDLIADGAQIVRHARRGPIFEKRGFRMPVEIAADGLDGPVAVAEEVEEAHLGIVLSSAVELKAGVRSATAISAKRWRRRASMG